MPQKLFLRKVSDIEREPDVGLRECETEKFLNELWEERMPESIWQQETGLAGAVRKRETERKGKPEKSPETGTA